MIRLLTTLVMFSVLLILVMPSTAHACTPAAMPDLETARTNADVMFLGRVIATDNSLFDALLSSDNETVLFELTSAWKGSPKSQAIVKVPNRVCGGTIHNFHQGEPFVVFANGSPAGSLDATSIGRTRAADKAAEDLAVLGEGNPPSQQADMRTVFYSQSYWSEVVIGVGLVGTFLLYIKLKRDAYTLGYLVCMS